MGRLLTLLAGILMAGAATAFPVSPSERAQAFATCAGQYSALVEHQRLFDGHLSEVTLQRRDTFVMLLDAVWPDAQSNGVPAPQAMAWRVTAKAQQQALLSQAVFGMLPDRARPAKAAAEANIARCDALLLGS